MQWTTWVRLLAAAGLRGRLRRWIVVASLATNALLTIAAVIEERRLLNEVETANARAFLAHLAEMTQRAMPHGGGRLGGWYRHCGYRPPAQCA